MSTDQENIIIENILFRVYGKASNSHCEGAEDSSEESLGWHVEQIRSSTES